MKAIIIIAFLFLSSASFGQKNKIPKTDTLGHDLRYDTVKAYIMYFDTGKVYNEHHIKGYIAKAQDMSDKYWYYFDSSKKKRIDKKIIMYAKEGEW